MINKKGLIPQLIELSGSFGQNKKDSYSNICGVITALSMSGLFLIQKGLLPDSLTPYLAGAIGVAQIWVSFLTGKNPQMPNDPRI